MDSKLLDDEIDDDDVAFNDNFDIDKLIESFARDKEKMIKAQEKTRELLKKLEK